MEIHIRQIFYTIGAWVIVFCILTAAYSFWAQTPAIDTPRIEMLEKSSVNLGQRLVDHETSQNVENTKIHEEIALVRVQVAGLDAKVQIGMEISIAFMTGIGVLLVANFLKARNMNMMFTGNSTQIKEKLGEALAELKGIKEGFLNRAA